MVLLLNIQGEWSSVHESTVSKQCNSIQKVTCTPSSKQALAATEINRIWNSQSVVKYNHYCVILLIDPLIKRNERRHYCVFVSDRVKLQVWLLEILTIEMTFENYSAVKYSKVEAATHESRLNIQTKKTKKKRQRSRFILQHQTQLNTEGLTQSCLRFTQTWAATAVHEDQWDGEDVGGETLLWNVSTSCRSIQCEAHNWSQS